MKEALGIAIAGLGTVGAGTLKILHGQKELISRRAGRPIEIVGVSARNPEKDRGIDLGGIQWFDDSVRMACDCEADIFVELVGGSEGPAKDAVEAALRAGKHVVTANKALVAHHGALLAALSDAHGGVLAYEAAVAGGIPIIKTLREGLAANEFSRVYGILNGTSNFILSEMRQSGRDFEEVLKDAQSLGYAEADPSFDIDGVDAAHKLSILAALAFGRQVDFAGVYIEGIRNISAFDIAAAEELGFRIKLLGVASRSDGGIEQRVHPCMVRKGTPIAAVEGVLNAVVAEGDAIGSIMVEGPGAGGGPTASAVVADIVDIARGNHLPAFTLRAGELDEAKSQVMARHRGSYYIRLTVLDQPGVIAEVSAILRDAEISMESMLQHGRANGEGKPVQVVITTHETNEEAMSGAIREIESSSAVMQSPVLIRIENI